MREGAENCFDVGIVVLEDGNLAAFARDKFKFFLIQLFVNVEG